MEKNIKEFLESFSVEELLERKVLIRVPLQRRMYNILKTNSVRPLIQLMKEQNIDSLNYPEFGWFLDSNGNFANPDSKEFTKGNIKDLNRLGAVFDDMNPLFNVHYQTVINH